MAVACQQTLEDNHDKEVSQVLQGIGIVNASKVTSTLQGSIWRASVLANINDTSKKTMTAPLVIKVTNGAMHEYSVAKVNNHWVRVQENILSEAKLMQFVTHNEECPKSIVKFYQLFKTHTDYYLIMEDGGLQLFQFVQRAHQFIQSGQLSLSHWQKVVRLIFKQMLECIDYLHRKNVCHLDISLENFLINDVECDIVQQEEAKLPSFEFVLDDIQVKLCDFGLAERFENDECLCNKFCGKRSYMSPEVTAKGKAFNAKKNDIWCLGVCLFLLSFGTVPWHTASPKDQAFNYIVAGYMEPMLKSWGMQCYADSELLNLLASIFQAESSRASLDEIRSHAWFKKSVQ